MGEGDEMSYIRCIWRDFFSFFKKKKKRKERKPHRRRWNQISYLLYYAKRKRPGMKGGEGRGRVSFFFFLSPLEKGVKCLLCR